MEHKGEMIIGGPELVEVWYFRAAAGLPAAKLTIVGGGDALLTTDEALKAGERLWFGGMAAARGIVGHVAAASLPAGWPRQPEVGVDYFKIGVESCLDADGRPCVELLMREIADGELRPIAFFRTQPQGAAAVATKLLMGMKFAWEADPIDAPEKVREPIRDELDYANQIFTHLAVHGFAELDKVIRGMGRKSE